VTAIFRQLEEGGRRKEEELLLQLDTVRAQLTEVSSLAFFPRRDKLARRLICVTIIGNNKNIF
jgi:hypothetical protein